MKRVLITQSNYIPWKGYFDNIAQCDVFVVYDDMQYTKRDWRNRNMIKTSQGPQWLTVPVEVKGKFEQPINGTRIAQGDWVRNHLAQMRHAYAKAPHFSTVHPWVESLYMERQHELLTDLNVHLLRGICSWLGITTKFRDSREFRLEGDRTGKLVGICRALGATEYLTGPAAKTYMELEAFEQAGVDVLWADYGGYAEYPQLFPPFTHGVSILDLLYNLGPEAKGQFKHLPA